MDIIKDYIKRAETRLDKARYYARRVISIKLFENGIDEEKFLTMDCHIIDDRGACGVSSLQLPTIDKVSRMNDGQIHVHYEGDDEDTWTNVDDIEIELLIKIADEL